MTHLMPSFAPETGQVVVQGAPAGAAGAVPLSPVPGLELAFDRVGGRLTEVVIDVARAEDAVAVDEITLDERVATLLIRLFGSQAPGRILSVAAARREPKRPRPMPFPDPDLTAALSRLADLDYVRHTSPLSSDSPWWAAEMAELATLAGLPGRALAEARLAVAPLLHWLLGPVPRQLPEQAVAAGRTVAAIAAAAEPAAARRLLAALESRSGSPPPDQSASTWDVEAEVGDILTMRVQSSGLQSTIDPALLGPGGPFRSGLTPCSELSVSRADEGADNCLLTVTARLARPAEADADALSRYRVRVVDPEVRRVLAQGPFASVSDPGTGRIQAELAVAYPLAELEETWIEVVPDKLHPVRSARAYRSGRALRWADAALRAERAPRGIAPQSTADDWAVLAAAAWDRCRGDWAAAGDRRRAELARPAHRLRPDEPDCLAEMLGG